MDDDYQREENGQRIDTDKKPSTVAKVVGKTVAALRADDDMNAVLKAFAALGPNAIEKCTVAEARRQPTVADAVRSVLKQQGRSTRPEDLVPGVRTVDRNIPTPAGELTARFYTPEGQGPFPVILYLHGGGWVIASLDVYDGGARGLAAAAGAIVVSVNYRQAPEFRFPAAWYDALASYRWISQNAASFGGDPSRLALAGESAGGCMAVATAVAIADAGLPTPRHILSVYPVAQSGSLNTPSYIENALAMPLNRAMVPWFLDKLLNAEAEKADPRLNLVHSRLSGLPPVTIINAQLDPLRSDGAMLAEALEKAGVPVERKDYTGVTHEFFGMAAVVHKAAEAQQYAGARLRAAFAL